MADVTMLKSAAERQLVAAWEAVRTRLPGSVLLREQAFHRFAAAGLPHRRVEEWKYTDLRALMREAYPLASVPDAAARGRAQSAGARLGDVERRRLFLVDGAFVPEWSELAGLEAGLTVRSMAAALAAGDPLIEAHLGRLAGADDPVVALNTALMGDGLLVRIAADVVLERPLHIVHVTTAQAPIAMFPRSLILVEPGARAMIIESHETAAGEDYQTIGVAELRVGDRAHVDHVKLIDDGMKALNVSTLAAEIGAHARFNQFSFVRGGGVVRNQLLLRFAGDASIGNIRGVSLLRQNQHADTTMVVDHVALGGQSREQFKTVLDGAARGVFQGRINVRPHAQKTDAKMMSQALLLSDEAEMANKPELEIFADDVQCGHGATCGALNEDLLFYLRARGIPEREAEALLIQAFVGEAVEGIEHARLRELLMEQVADWLARRGGDALRA